MLCDSVLDDVLGRGHGRGRRHRRASARRLPERAPGRHQGGRRPPAAARTWPASRRACGPRRCSSHPERVGEPPGRWAAHRAHRRRVRARRARRAGGARVRPGGARRRARASWAAAAAPTPTRRRRPAPRRLARSAAPPRVLPRPSRGGARSPAPGDGRAGGGIARGGGGHRSHLVGRWAPKLPTTLDRGAGSARGRRRATFPQGALPGGRPGHPGRRRGRGRRSLGGRLHGHAGVVAGPGRGRPPGGLRSTEPVRARRPR